MRKKLMRIVLPVVAAGTMLAGVGVETANASIAPVHYVKKGDWVGSKWTTARATYQHRQMWNCTITYNSKNQGTRHCGKMYIGVDVRSTYGGF
jgi:hypothetical protein